MIDDYVPLVRKMVKRFAAGLPHLDIDELTSLGLETVWKCSLKWRPGEHVTFGLYASRALENTYRQEFAKRCRKKNNRTGEYSLSVVNGEGEEEFLDLHSPTDWPFRALEKRRLYEALAGLPERQAQILWRRACGESLDDIAATYGVSRERIRQIEPDALAKLKDQYAKKILHR